MELKEKILEVISGERLAAIATVSEDGGQVLPAVRYMVTFGLDDMTLVTATYKSSRKVAQIKKNPRVALTIWQGGDYSSPYVVIKAEAEVREDQETRDKFWCPMLESHFKGPDDPEYVVLEIVPYVIEYCHQDKVAVWEG